MNHKTANTTDDDEEEEKEEVFHESLDRIASSSSRSCSNSDEEPDESISVPKFPALRAPGMPLFPVGLPKYDVWVSQPSSVSERRSRLLLEMGMSLDPDPLQMRPGAGSGHGDFCRSVSSSQLGFAGNGGGCGISRSKSDNSVKTSPGSGDRRYASSCSCSNSFVSLENSLGSSVNSGDCSGVARLGHHLKMGSEIASANSGAKSLSAKYSERLDECNSDGTVSADGLSAVSELSVVNDGACTIKDLDNGKEFVVNEIKEDGIKEVGTGRQLTFEEFQMTVGHSPIVQELLRRQNVDKSDSENPSLNGGGSFANGSKSRKRNGWLKSIRSVASAVASSRKERRSSDEKDSSSEKGGRMSSSATEDSQDGSFHGPERVKVRQYGKSTKELTALYKSQEIHAHNGSIWSIKFSLDGRYLASAGEDCVIHVWKVAESDRKGELLNEKPENGSLNLLVVATGSPEVNVLSRNGDNDNYLERKRSGRLSMSRKSVSWDNTFVPDTVFALSEKPICSFEGHLDDVLDLSWSKSQHLLSSSMDKTVRLWHLSSDSCLKVFSHNDYVTCIQFNPIDDRYFISGSLDAKVRIWSIPDQQVIDWNDIHEMVTAACYRPDGQGALAGSYNGICHLYDTSDNKLLLKSQINLQYKKKKSQIKKITGFQFAPGSSSEVLITSADSRIRVVDDVDLVHKFTGFRNTNSQISASFSANGKYVVSASEDSAVYVWSHEANSRPSRSKGVTITHSYEHFHCQDVSVAIPWPGIADAWGLLGTFSLSEQRAAKADLGEKSTVKHPPTPVEKTNNGPLHGTLSSATNNYFMKRISGTRLEEKLAPSGKIHNPRFSVDFSNRTNGNMSTWDLVIVTAGLGGEIRVYQNFGVHSVVEPCFRSTSQLAYKKR